MIDSNTKKIETSRKQKDKLEEELRQKHKELSDCADVYKNNFDVDINSYEEFVNNRYIDGRFYKEAKGLFMNRRNDYKIVSDLYDLYELARNQKLVNKLEHIIELSTKLSNLTLKEYTEILRIYYTEVHKHLILEGEGYVFGDNIGWICINRCVLENAKPTLNYAATKKREEELKAQGKRIWNKDEADWCLRNGIEYKAEDKRVFMDNEYCYEIPLLGCKLPNGNKLKLTISDYRHKSIRGKTNEDLAKECNYDTNKICELSIDLKTKLTICDKVDKILYTKFIRNENQKPVSSPKANRKSRQ
jgi:hypothetical protein